MLAFYSAPKMSWAEHMSTRLHGDTWSGFVRAKGGRRKRQRIEWGNEADAFYGVQFELMEDGKTLRFAPLTRHFITASTSSIKQDFMNRHFLPSTPYIMELI